METEKHYCKINEYAIITIYIHMSLWHVSIMFIHYVYPPPPLLLSTMHLEIENQKANNTFCIASSAEKRREDWKEKQVDKNTPFYSPFRT